MTVLTKQHLQAQKQCEDVIRGLGTVGRAQIVEHLVNLQVGYNQSLIRQSDPVRMHRHQGEVTALQTVIDLFDNDPEQI